MYTLTLKHEELAAPVKAPSNNSHCHRFPPLQPQDGIGRNYQVGSGARNNESILSSIKKQLSSKMRRLL